MNELFEKIIAVTGKSNVLKVFVIVCAGLYFLGFDLKMIESGALEKINTALMVYIVLFNSMVFEHIISKFKKLEDRKVEIPCSNTDEIKQIGENSVAMLEIYRSLNENVIATNNTLRQIVKDSESNPEFAKSLIKQRIEMVKNDISTIMMPYVTTGKLSKVQISKINEDVERYRRRFIFDYNWFYRYVNRSEEMPKETRISVDNAYDIASTKLCDLISNVVSVDDRLSQIEEVEYILIENLKEIFLKGE